jgi:proline iminopeptidase
MPRRYDVPAFHSRQGTQFWNLSDGSRIGYTLLQAKGEKKPFPVIFLQGGPGSPVSDQNIMLLDTLAGQGYDVYLYDLLGCGHSSRLKNIRDYTAMRHVRDLEEIVEQIGALKVILLGQSWGAILATLYIADNQSKVERAIFTGPGPVIPVNKALQGIIAPDSLKLMRPVHSNREANLKVNNIRTRFVGFCALKFGIKLAPDSEMDAFQTLLDIELSRSTVCDTAIHRKPAPGSGFYAQVMTIRSFSSTGDPRPKLKDCKVPLLIMKGQCDNQPWGYTSEYFELFPDHSFAYFPGAGHSISAEQPKLFRREIIEFLNR